MAFRLNYLLHISDSKSILRRYFVVNGYDGALTMLGLILGFIMSNNHASATVFTVCLSAAIALAVSGISSAYISESSEREHSLQKLESAMLDDLSESLHAEATKWIPWVVAAVNGLSPFIISLLILSPIWLDAKGIVSFRYSPLYLSIFVAACVLFLMGVFLARLTRKGWLFSGLQTTFTAVITCSIIYLLTG